MHPSKIISLLWLLISLPGTIESSRISFFGSNHKRPLFKILGSDCPYGITLDVPVTFSCTCFTGLWALYSNGCNGPSKIIGSLEEKCIFLNQTLQKLHLLSAPDGIQQTAVIFSSGLRNILGRDDPREKDRPLLIPGSGRTELLLSAGSHNWSLNPINKCLAAKPKDSFCFYRYDTRNYITLEPHCGNGTDANMEIIPVGECTQYVTEHSPECLDVVKPRKTKKSSSNKGKGKHAPKSQNGRTIVRSKTEGASSKGPGPRESEQHSETEQQSTVMSQTVTPTEPSRTTTLVPTTELQTKLVTASGMIPTPTDNPTTANSSAVGNVYRDKSLSQIPMSEEPLLNVATTTFPTSEGTTKTPPTTSPQPDLTTSTRTSTTVTTSRPQFHNSTPKGDELEIIVVKAPAPHLYSEMVKAKAIGRTFRKKDSSSSGRSGATVNSSLPEYHEDWGVTFNIEIPEISSQLWNYFTSRALEILNLTTPSTKPPLSPSLSFLQISKKIIQKACPDHYAGDGHFELALQTFISLQKKVFSFNDPFSDHPARQRIEDSLNICLQNITEYPFVDARQRNGTDCNSTVEMGTFLHHGGQSILNISEVAAPKSREPLIETVWKIFTHAHAACFSYFEDNGFNDHHRFTSVLIPLFTNGINDMWKNISEVNEDTYSGLLGDTVKVMEGVAYCAEYAKLETEYPWELSRPEKEIQGETGKGFRRRRSASGEGVCLRETYENSCTEIG